MTLDVEGGRSDTGFRCVAREGLLFSPHCKMCSVVRSVIMVPSFPSYYGNRRAGLSRLVAIQNRNSNSGIVPQRGHLPG